MSVGQKRKRSDDDCSLPPGWEEARERIIKRRKRASDMIPDRIKRANFDTITDNDIRREMNKSRRRLCDSAPSLTLLSRSSSDHSIDKRSDPINNDDTVGDDVESVDLEELKAKHQKEKRMKNASILMDKLVEHMATFETLNKIISQWLTSKFIGCRDTNAHISIFMRYIVTERIRFRVFKSRCGTKDELYLIGTKIEFAIPFVCFDNDVKMVIAMIMKRSALFFEKCHIVKQGVCGRFYSEFKYDLCLEEAMQKHRFRDQMLQHFTICVLHTANQVGMVRSATSTLLTMATNVIGKYIAPMHASRLSHSDREMRLVHEMEGALDTMFKFLLDAKTVAMAIIAFSRNIEQYGPAIKGVSAQARLTQSDSNVPIIRKATKPLCGGPQSYQNNGALKTIDGGGLRK